MSSNLHKLINTLDESIATIRRLAELGPAMDEGGAVYFPNAIEILALITPQASHLEQLSAQLVRCVLPCPCRVEDER